MNGPTGPTPQGRQTPQLTTPARMLSPDEFARAQTGEPPSADSPAPKSGPTLPLPIAQPGGTTFARESSRVGKDTTGHPKEMTGFAGILAKYVAAPITEHPLLTAGLIGAQGVPVLGPAIDYALLGMMGKDILEYSAQRAAEYSLPNDVRKEAEHDSGALSPDETSGFMKTFGLGVADTERTSGEQAAASAAFMALPLAARPIRAAARKGAEGVAELQAKARAWYAVKSHAMAVADEWKQVFGPGSRSAEAKETELIIRASSGERAMAFEQSSAQVQEFGRAVGHLPESDKLGFVDAIEHGQSQVSDEFQEVADAIRGALDERRKIIQGWGEGYLEDYYENYFPHSGIWADAEKAEVTYRNLVAGRRPMEGTKAFLKERSIPTVMDGWAAGVPLAENWNPVDVFVANIRDMDKFIAAKNAFRDVQTAGLTRLVRSADEMQSARAAGYAPVDAKGTKLFTVFGPKRGAVKLPEGASMTSGAVSALDDSGRLRRSLTNVSDDALQQEYARLAELHGSEQSAFDAVQESAYRMDYEALPDAERTGRSRRTTDEHGNRVNRKQEDLPDADGTVDPDVLERDNKIVRDYHRGKTVRVARERAMRRIEQEMAKRPSATDFNFGANQIRETGEIPQSWRRMRPEEVEVLGRRIMGEHWMPESAARVFNNYLSRGWVGKPAYDLVRGTTNTLNQAQLGLSAFHLGFTSMDATVSRAALGLEYIAEGRPLRGLAEVMSAPMAPLPGIVQGLVVDPINALAKTDTRAGHLLEQAGAGDLAFGKAAKLRQAYLNPEKATPDMLALVNALAESGGRVKQDAFYKTSAPEKFMDALRVKDPAVMARYSVPAFFEAAAKPIMEHVVPLQKLGIFADLAEKELAKLPADASTFTRRAALASAWDSVDNRMGQLVYDNLFWNRAAKDLAMASVRSVGWNVGTIRELGGGAIDWAHAIGNNVRNEGADFELTHRMAYVAALPIMVGLYGAVYQMLRTGQPPAEMKDYFYPRTGDVDADGQPERVQLPSYMKDFFAYGGHPWQTLKHKVSPGASAVFDMLENQDYYGDEIRNPNDPILKQVLQEAQFMAKEMLPFAIQNMSESRARGDSFGSSAQAFVGITPAPREEVRSDAENMMARFQAERRTSGATPEDVEARQTRRDILGALRSNVDGSRTEDIEGAVTDAIERHQLTPKDVTALLKRAGLTPDQERFKHLTVEQAMEVFKAASPDEKAKFGSLLFQKIDRAVRAGRPVAVSDEPSDTPATGSDVVPVVPASSGARSLPFSIRR